MRSISSVHQRLASNLGLPAIALKYFVAHRLTFQCSSRVSRKEFYDGTILMTVKRCYVLQFLSGEAKEAVKSFEAVDGGVYEAMRVLEARYGRKCEVVSSISDGLTKGLPITGKDRVALRNFADKVVSAATTLKNFLNEVNQGNLAEMSRRLRRYLQERFVVIAHDLKARKQGFPSMLTLAHFSRDRRMWQITL